MSETVLDLLTARLREAAIYNRHDLAPPSVVLWTDGEQLWTKVISYLVAAMPELLVLEPEESDDRRGPSTWLRYQLARGNWRETPIIYLPGIPRQVFRGAAGFPEDARHLFALQFQGQFWTQANGKDWTPSAFLSSNDGGLGLDLARDKASLDALAAQLTHVLRSPVKNLQGRKLEASDFHSLAASDSVGLLLAWMAAPAEFRQQSDAETWTAFVALCGQQFGLHPEKDGVITSAEKLVVGGGAWDAVWKRYVEAPKTYAGVRKALDRVQSKDLFDDKNDRIPANNRHRENTLRDGLLELSTQPVVVARRRLANLCDVHVERASSLWAELGEAPLARAAVHLQKMVEAIDQGSLGSDWSSVATSYVERGWWIDASAWKALAAVRNAPDVHAVSSALRGVHLPWLEQSAEQINKWAANYPGRSPEQSPEFHSDGGTVLVFVDGLRCDLGLELQALLRDQGLEVSAQPRWTALPTVTATAKPAWRPFASTLNGSVLGEGFEPCDIDTGKPLKSQGFRNKLAANGWTWLEASELGDPSRASWTEIGNFDHDGHAMGARLAWRIEEELRAVCLRVRELVGAGWKKAILVTDHGWLLMPDGLPKADLPAHLTLSRWARCAVPQLGAKHSFSEVPWFWGQQHSVVLAPGVCAFKAGQEYVHGGLSIQEALTLIMTVTPSQKAVGQLSIESVKWVGLRVRVTLAGEFHDTKLDIRTKPMLESSSLLAEDQRLKAPAEDGGASMLISSDEHMGSAAVLVVIRDGDVVAKRPVTVGEN